MKYATHSLEETEKIANDFVSSLSPSSDRAVVVGLYGELGAGKTTFTQAVAKTFGITENITSPTFVIMKVYDLSHTWSHLIHIDAYRLEKSEELLHLGWKDIISDKKNIILIEWPEKVAPIMPEHWRINLKHISENEREIDILKE